MGEIFLSSKGSEFTRPFILPNNWTWALSEEVCSSVRDGTHDTPKYVDVGIPLITSKNLKTGELNFTTAKFISLEDHEQISVRSGVEDGDILYAMIGTIGHPVVVSNNFTFSIKNIGLFKQNRNIIKPEYLKYWLSCSLYEELLESQKLIKGTTQKFIPLKNLRSLPVPLPPLNEQYRIVKKIETLTTHSRKAREALDAIPPLLDQFRQSVLAAAFRGDLTVDWQIENPDMDWHPTVLGKVLSEKPRNGFSPKGVDYPTKVKSFTLSATTSGVFKPEYIKYVDEEIPNDSYLWLEPGDVLVQRANTLEYVGTSAIYSEKKGEFIYPDLVMKLKAKPECLDHKFLHYFLSFRQTRAYFKANATGTAGNMPKINQKIVISTPINLPCIEEQKVIVNRIEKLFNTIQSIESNLIYGIAESERLNRSILAKAFRGELVPQDPTDEPATLLLNRIRTERAKTQKTKKSQRKKKG